MFKQQLDWDERNVIELLESDNIVLTDFEVKPRTIKGTTHYALVVSYIRLGTQFVYQSTIDNFKTEQNAFNVGNYWANKRIK